MVNRWLGPLAMMQQSGLMPSVIAYSAAGSAGLQRLTRVNSLCGVCWCCRRPDKEAEPEDDDVDVDDHHHHHHHDRHHHRQCTLNSDGCDAEATGVNNLGSFTCARSAGYSGDGVTCQPLSLRHL